MAKYSVGDMVIPHWFESVKGKVVFSPTMGEYTTVPGEITEIDDDSYLCVHGFWWPESALTSPDPEGVPVAMPVQASPLVQAGAKRQYDLGEFTKAAMNGICASSPAWSGNMELGDFGSMAVRIARVTIKALQEAEKEEKL